VIARPRLDVPVPDGIALRVARQLPPRVQVAVGEAAEAGRLYAACRGTQYAEARQLLEARLRVANKLLAAHDPRLVHGWADLPGTNR
jgi:hypothetical protein